MLLEQVVTENISSFYAIFAFDLVLSAFWNIEYLDKIGTILNLMLIIFRCPVVVREVRFTADRRELSPGIVVRGRLSVNAGLGLCLICTGCCAGGGQ